MSPQYDVIKQIYFERVVCIAKVFFYSLTECSNKTTLFWPGKLSEAYFNEILPHRTCSACVKLLKEFHVATSTNQINLHEQ